MKLTFFKSILNLLSQLLLTLSLTQTALSEETYIIEDITVSARKKKEKIEDVPVAVTKQSEQQIADSRSESVREIVQSAPNVLITGSSSGRYITPYIRGKGNQDIQLPEESSVGVTIDQVPLPRYAFDLDMIDIENVEVLRGPQGTLFGKNTQAGAINIQSNLPLSNGRSFVSGGLGNLDAREAKLKLNHQFPESGGRQLGSNFNLAYKKQDGFVEDTLQNKKWGDREKFSLKEVLQYKFGGPTAQDQIVLNVRHDQEKGTDAILAARNQNPHGKERTRQDIPPLYEDRLTLASVKLDKDLGNAHFTSISSFNYHHFDFKYDEDDGLIAGNLIPASMINDPGRFYREFNEYERQYFQELRVQNRDKGLSKDGDQVTSWNMGLNMSFLNYRLISFLDTLTGSLAPAQIQQDIQIKSLGLGLFGHLDQALNERNILSLGARLSRDEKDYSSLHQASSSVPNAVVPHYRQNSEKSFDDYHALVGLTHKLNRNANVYATLSRGYQAGGYPAYQFNNYAGIAADQAPYDKSIVYASEVGTKAHGWDKKLRLQFSLFYDNIRNKQVRVRDRQSNLSTYANLDSRTYGSELEVQASPLQALDVGFNVGYTQAEFMEDLVSANTQIRKGQRVANVPQWNGSSFVQHRLMIGPWNSLLFSRVDYQYVGSRYGESENLTRMGSYGLWNASVGVERNEFEVHFFVKNIFDKEYETQAYYYSTFQTTVSTPTPPRRLGLNMKYYF